MKRIVLPMEQDIILETVDKKSTSFYYQIIKCYKIKSIICRVKQTTKSIKGSENEARHWAI
jgi:hypothetical protein